MVKIIKIQFIAFILITIAIFVKTQMDSERVTSQNKFNTDVTHDLTDSDLKLALSDLSLNELNSLQTFMDSADSNYLDYQENSSTNKKLHSLDHNQPEHDSANDNSYDYNFEPKDIENNLVDYVEGQRSAHTFSQENQRAKRDDQMLSSNDEYIKQLIYSFPQNEQLKYYDNERENSHIRVKRN